MYTLTKTGVPISNALKKLADGTKNKAMSSALNGMVEHLESGQDIASSMQYYPRIFTPLMISMVKVGQTSGHLAESFLRISQYLELEGSAAKNIKTALRYPMFVSIAMIAAIVLINIFVIPAFSGIFSQAHVALPAVTRFFIATSNFFVHYWVGILIASVVVVGGVIYYIKTPAGTIKWHYFLLHMPIVGKMLNKLVILRFAQSFAIVIDAGVQLIEGIELVSQSINNEYARSRILLMRESIERGNTLTQAAITTGLFTSLELQMLSVSEETGELSLMLNQIAEYYRREVDYDLKRLNDIIEPLLIVALSGVVLILAFAVYLPIWNMAQVAKM